MTQTFAKIIPFLVVILFSSWALAASGYEANISKVEVTGRAAISDDQTQIARRRALEDALYLAALKVGADISGAAITSKGILLRDVVKLDAQGQLVDFKILGEKNIGTHYEVKVQAFFAKKNNKACLKPRYPTVRIMVPKTKVSSNVDVAYTFIADYLAKQIIRAFVESYSGPSVQSDQKSLSDVKSLASKNLLFDYNSLQSTNARNLNITEEFMLHLDIFSRVKDNRLNSYVKLALVERDGYTAALHHEHMLSSKLPSKLPLRSLNVLTPKSLKVSMDDISDLVSKAKNRLTQMVCNPLETETVFTAGKLKLGLGNASGIKKGALAYVTSGSESWTLLEVIKVTQTSSTLKPINSMSNPEKLANLTVRFIEGTL